LRRDLAVKARSLSSAHDLLTHLRNAPMPPTQPRSASFIVRLWHEPHGEREQNPSDWRLSIEEIDTPGRFYFKDPHAIGEFIRDWIERCGAGSSH
jgi:hypothetical protein